MTALAPTVAPGVLERASDGDHDAFAAVVRRRRSPTSSTLATSRCQRAGTTAVIDVSASSTDYA